MEFSEVVKQIRKQLGIPQEEFARELKISFTAIQNNISRELIKALKRA